MSFWNKSTGEAATATTDQEGAESGKLVRIPDNTMLLAALVDLEMNRVREEDFMEDVYEHDGFKATWCILEEGEYKGVMVKQAIRVLSQKTSQRDQALDVLAFMDLIMNDGKFMAAGEQPDLMEMLEAFQNKPQIVKIRAMKGTHSETGDETYNQWVSGIFRKKQVAAIASPTKEAAVAHAMKQMDKTQPKPQPAANATPTARPLTPAQRKAQEAAAAAAAAAAEAEAEAEAQAKADEDASVQRMAKDVADQMEGSPEDNEPVDY